MRVAIHGLDRVGRLLLRLLIQEPGLELVAVADAADARVLAHLIKHDSVHGRAPFPVAHQARALVLDGRAVPLLAPGEALLEARPDLVVDFSGDPALPDRILGPGSPVSTLMLGHATHARTSSHSSSVQLLLAGERPRPGARVLGLASPSAACLELLLRALDEAFGVEAALATDVQSYAPDQRLLDLPHPDPRLARAVPPSMIPAESSAVAELCGARPVWKGRLEAQAVRVPTPDLCLLDLSAVLGSGPDAAAVNAAFARAAAGPLAGSLEVLEEELVSPDLKGSRSACLLDPFLTRVFGGRLVKVFGWYDPEPALAWRFLEACRSLEVAP